MVGMTGGIFGEFSTANETNRRGQLYTDAMNKLASKANKGADNFMRRKAFTDAMDGWSKEDNKFEFKNAEDNEMFRQINAFMSTGREQDLYDIMDMNFEDMSHEQLENIAKMTSPMDYNIPWYSNVPEEEKEKDTSGWRNPTGGYMTDTEQGTEEMRQALIKKRESMKRDIDNYGKALGEVRSRSNRDVNQSEDEIAELTWLLWKSGKMIQRVHDIREEDESNLNTLDEALNDLEETFTKIINTPTDEAP